MKPLREIRENKGRTVEGMDGKQYRICTGEKHNKGKSKEEKEIEIETNALECALNELVYNFEKSHHLEISAIVFVKTHGESIQISKIKAKRI